MPDGHKKIFISWSKAMSKRVAGVLKEYLPEILDGVDLFMSDKDIGPGERSMKVLESQLDGTTYGLLVVTTENQGESWLNFEAGALSKQVGKDEDDLPRVVPLLVDIDNPNQLTGPVSQFQGVKLDSEGLLRTSLSIATLVGSDTTVIEKRFKRTWPDMEKAIAEAQQGQLLTKKPVRSVESKVDEVLQILRAMQRREDVDFETSMPRLGSERQRVAVDMERAIVKRASKYYLVPEQTLINPFRDFVEISFRTTKNTTAFNLRDFEREVRKIISPREGKIIYVDEKGMAEIYLLPSPENDPHDAGEQAGDDHAT
jgi:hypothetical protein